LLIIAVDYFSKCIEAELLATITSAKVQNLFQKFILSKFGIPQTVVKDNGTQLTNKGFRALMENLYIKHHFTSAEHPQTNGQAEVGAKKNIMRG